MTMSSKSSLVLRAAGRRVPRHLQVTKAQGLHGSSPPGQAPVTAGVALQEDSMSHRENGQSNGRGANSSSDTSVGSLHQVRDMMELPGPPGWPVVGNFLTYVQKQNVGKIHQVQANYHKKFGPIFREKWGSKWQVHVGDPDLMEHVYRHQGRFPNRPGIEAWNLYKKINDIPQGLFTSQGEQWYKCRSLLDKKLLSPNECIKFFHPLDQVSQDLVSRIELIRENQGDEALARALPKEFYRWGVECVGVLLFDRRLGCLEQEMKEESQRFVDGFNNMLDSSMKLIVGEKLQQRLNTPIWRQHATAWDSIYSTAKTLIQQRLETLKMQKAASAGGSSGCPFSKSASSRSTPSYLGDVFDSGKLSMAEIYSNFSEIMIGGADTTSNTLCFILNQLALNPDVQGRLQEEIDDVTREIGEDGNPVGKMTYLDAVIKETLRMFPLATMQCRILDSDLVVGGYRIPKNTLFVLNHYASCRDPNVFENPEEFVPDRWIRGGRSKFSHHPFASMPFGYGKRMCLGKRFARLELHQATIKILRRFDIQPIEDMPFEPRVRTIHYAGDQIPVRFVNR